MTVPESFVGAWRRTGLFIDGVRRVDFSDVLWLQTPTWFADIRLRMDRNVEPLDAPSRRMARTAASAGIAEWTDPIMTWRPTLGVRADFPVDRYRLDRRDNVVVEYGSLTAGTTEFTFAEEWLRMTGPSETHSVVAREQYLSISIGRWSIEVSPDDSDAFVAVRRDRIGDRWTEIGNAKL
jgi:hypothetical protein